MTYYNESRFIHIYKTDSASPGSPKLDKQHHNTVSWSLTMKKNLSLTSITTVFVVIATFAIAVFMAYDRTLKKQFDPELFLLLFRFLLTIVLAGLGILAYRIFSIERDLRATRRTDLEFVYRELRDTHLQIMHAIHGFRARIGFERGNDSYKERVIVFEDYESALKTILQCQLVFRSNSNRVRDYHLGYAQANQLADQLQAIDSAFNPLVEEYEAEAINVRDNEQKTRLRDLPELSEFIALESQNHPLAGQTLRAFEAAVLGLSKARHQWDPQA
ncbi:MAG: hypothetical protein HOI66_09320 [Verrucomicrobia bacterium]|nr:hypothetical protein [Verrucomicrobiota bacterium]MDB4745997.1 hypothetical protein [Verrucomicrobiota bacterium]